MSLLDKASLIVTPNAGKTGKLYSVIPSDGSGDLTVIRATTATRVNSAGLIEVVPRNLLTYSNGFNAGTWAQARMSIVNNTTISPDGNLNASSFIEDLSLESHPLYVYNIPYIIGQSYNVSIYVKKGSRDYLVITATGSGAATFNLNNGTTSSLNAIITPYNNGFYRCSFTFIPTSSVSEIYFEPAINGVTYYQGNGSTSLYIYGAQLDQGSLATEYFPTTTRLNIPRIDYTNGSCPAILIEPQRTNLVLRSEEFQTIWTNERSSEQVNVIVSPAGILTGTKLVEDTTATSSHLILQGIGGLASGSTLSFTVYVKAAERTSVRLQINDGVSLANAVFANYNVSTGTASATQSIGTFTGASSTISPVGNGWYRCSISGVATGVIAVQVRIFLLSAGNIVYTGDGTSGVYIWGAQLETGAYPTSYIPTLGSAQTRNLDNISKTAVSALIGQTEGTIFAEVRISRLIGTVSRYIFHISDGTANNRIYIAFSGASSNIIRARIFKAGNLETTIETSTITTTGRYKLALAYKNNDVVFYVNGVQIGTDVTASIPACSRVDLGQNYIAASQFADSIINANIFKTRLTNTELQNLTTL